MSETEVIPESPDVVKGGPLDPTAPEGQPPEGQVVGGPGGEPQDAPEVPEPLHRGLAGDIKTPEDLKTYAQSLEQLLVAAQAKAQAPVNQPAAQPSPLQPSALSGNAKEKFSELIFSKPDEAFEIAVSEATQRIQAQEMQKARVAEFWDRFYEKNADLKRLKPLVQSVVERHKATLDSLKTADEVEAFLSKETRSVIDLVKKESGHTERVIPSQSAITLGGSREPVPASPKPPAQPLNFTDQILRLRPRGRK